MALIQEQQTTVLLVRHGETEWNVQHRIQGQGDSALTEAGERQAELLGDRLAGTHIDAVYSSDLTRALRTAEAIAERHALRPILDRGLRERGFGRWEGLTLDQAREDDAEALDMWQNDLENFRPPGAESSNDMRRRACDALQRILADCPGKRIVIVSHSGPVRQMLAATLEMPGQESRRLRIANASITTLQAGPERITLVTFNDTCHLET